MLPVKKEREPDWPGAVRFSGPRAAPRPRATSRRPSPARKPARRPEAIDRFALRELTGQDFGLKADEWRAFLRREGLLARAGPGR